MNIRYILMGVALLVITGFIVRKEMKRIQQDKLKHGKSALAVLVMDLLSFSPFYLAFGIGIVGIAFLLKGVGILK